MLGADNVLPPLREDLVLHQGAVQNDGAPSWMIEDPLRGRFLRIGWLEYEVLQRWQLGNAQAVAEAVSRQTLLRPEVNEVLAVREFFMRHELLINQALMQRLSQAPLPKPGLATQAENERFGKIIPENHQKGVEDKDEQSGELNDD